MAVPGPTKRTTTPSAAVADAPKPPKSSHNSGRKVEQLEMDRSESGCIRKTAEAVCGCAFTCCILPPIACYVFCCKAD